jgi:hypothetical protein
MHCRHYLTQAATLLAVSDQEHYLHWVRPSAVQNWQTLLNDVSFLTNLNMTIIL